MSDGLREVTRVDFQKARSRLRRSRRRKKNQLAAGVPLAVLIPRRLDGPSEIVMLHEPRSLPAEMFRRLRTSLAGREDPAQVLLVTSAVPGEGRASVATNLALAFAESATERVLLVDADMRHPFLHRWIEPHPHIGLAEVLSSTADLEHAMHPLSNTPLKALPAGVRGIDPLLTLSARSFAELLDSFRDRFGRIIIHAPSVLAFPEAEVIGELSDGALIVVKAGATSRRNYLAALSALQQTRILGTVRNSATLNIADRHPHLDRFNAEHYRAPAHRARRNTVLERFRTRVIRTFDP